MKKKFVSWLIANLITVLMIWGALWLLVIAVTSDSPTAQCLLTILSAVLIAVSAFPITYASTQEEDLQRGLNDSKKN